MWRGIVKSTFLVRFCFFCLFFYHRNERHFFFRDTKKNKRRELLFLFVSKIVVVVVVLFHLAHTGGPVSVGLLVSCGVIGITRQHTFLELLSVQ
jgi:hypothetical protein